MGTTSPLTSVQTTTRHDAVRCVPRSSIATLLAIITDEATRVPVCTLGGQIAPPTPPTSPERDCNRPSPPPTSWGPDPPSTPQRTTPYCRCTCSSMILYRHDTDG